ncbi:MAG TPA: lysylphosphatidylglycerol synthase transmembrane domain-containing protein [Acidimicrobiales bacterium]|nr:lysylphosphatidylglycerol synthase transmembrane domain-containing protein [Acidimicrobiales bacterium]
MGAQDGTPIEVVDDQDATRIRKPVDVLRFVAACAGLAVLVVVGLVARRTAAGVESDVVGAGRRLTGGVLGAMGVISGVAAILVVSATAIDHLVRRQFGLLTEAVAIGGFCTGATVAANAVLHTAAASEFAATLVTVPHGGVTSPLDPGLAGLVGFLTLSGIRSGWSGWGRAAIGVFVLDSLATRHTTVLGELLALVLAYAIAVLARYAAGLPSSRPSALDVAKALCGTGLDVARIVRVDDGTPDRRRYAATSTSGQRLDVTVLDRDQEAAGALYSLYRALRVRSPVSQVPPLSVERALERQELMSFAVAAAGVVTPRVLASVPVGSEAAALAFEPIDGVPLSTRGPEVTDAELADVWRAVQRLHDHRVTHGALTADRIVLLSGAGAALVAPEEGAVAAGDLALRLDDAQLLVELSLLAGTARTAAIAAADASPDDLARTAPLLQRVALQRTTRAALKAHPGLLAELRQRLADAGRVVEPEPVRLERVSVRSVLSLVAAVAATYLLLTEVTTVDLGTVLRKVDWSWAVAALALSAATYVIAAANLLAFVRERLNAARTVLAQAASAFVALVMPSGTGSMSVNILYLERSGVPPSGAVASVGASQVVAFALHAVLLVVFSVIAGRGGLSFSLPSWAWYVLVSLGALALAVVALPQGRGLLRARLAPILSQMGPRLLEIVQRPLRLAEGIGSALALSGTYILCLVACVHAVGGSAGFATIAVVYLTGSALGSVVPTPGGIGTVEAAMTAALTAAGLHSATALTAVLLFRLVTLWLPVPVGWVAFKVLERRGAL